MKYSLCFLNYDPKNDKGIFAQQSLESILNNSRNEDCELIIVKDVLGYVHAVNCALKNAQGDFIFILNDDILINDPDWLKKMAIAESVSSWRFHQFHLTGDSVPDGACWCVSRGAYNKIGLMDTVFASGYGFDDSDYWYRAKELNVPLVNAEVDIKHLENKTYSSKYFIDSKWLMTYENESLFRIKWENKLKFLS